MCIAQNRLQFDARKGESKMSQRCESGISDK